MTRELYKILLQCLKFCHSSFKKFPNPLNFATAPKLLKLTIFLCPDEVIDPIPTDVIKFGRKFGKIGLNDYPIPSLQETLKKYSL